LSCSLRKVWLQLLLWQELLLQLLANLKQLPRRQRLLLLL
jgi:hypothetical protein